MHDSWKPFLKAEFNKPYFKQLSEFLAEVYDNKTIFPPKNQVFSAFATPLDKVKVIIVGQDPYHTPGIAHGLAFSVRPGAKIPPSIQNIFKEIESDLGHSINHDPHLQRWADQGVLLLNKVLTVEAHLAGSHWNKGWETFTESVINFIDQRDQPVVYLLWGRQARDIKSLIKSKNALILEAAHPSPLSARNGFFGCKHFSKANAYLLLNDQTPIEW
jgi:uracil-DNA glycosylase